MRTAMLITTVALTASAAAAQVGVPGAWVSVGSGLALVSGTGAPQVGFACDDSGTLVVQALSPEAAAVPRITVRSDTGGGFSVPTDAASLGAIDAVGEWRQPFASASSIIVSFPDSAESAITASIPASLASMIANCE